jgi:hypothetical protein
MFLLLFLWQPHWPPSCTGELGIAREPALRAKFRTRSSLQWVLSGSRDRDSSIQKSDQCPDSEIRMIPISASGEFQNRKDTGNPLIPGVALVSKFAKGPISK